jgi:hypothetical protein
MALQVVALHAVGHEAVELHSVQPRAVEVKDVELQEVAVKGVLLKALRERIPTKRTSRNQDQGVMSLSPGMGHRLPALGPSVLGRSASDSRGKNGRSLVWKSKWFRTLVTGQ